MWSFQNIPLQSINPVQPRPCSCFQTLAASFWQIYSDFIPLSFLSLYFLLLWCFHAISFFFCLLLQSSIRNKRLKTKVDLLSGLKSSRLCWSTSKCIVVLTCLNRENAEFNPSDLFLKSFLRRQKKSKWKCPSEKRVGYDGKPTKDGRRMDDGKTKSGRVKKAGSESARSDEREELTKRGQKRREREDRCLWGENCSNTSLNSSVHEENSIYPLSDPSFFRALQPKHSRRNIRAPP